MKKKGVNVLPKQKISLKQIMPTASNNLIDLLEEMLILNPEKRIIARNIMIHPFFEKVERVIPGNVHKEAKKYLEEIFEPKRKIPMMKSLSPNTTVSNVRYSPMREQIPLNKYEFGKESQNIDSNTQNHRISLVHNIPVNNNINTIQIPTLPVLGSNYIQTEPKYKFSYPPVPVPSVNTSVNQSVIPELSK